MCERDYIVRRYFDIYLKKELCKEPVLLSYYPTGEGDYDTYPKCRRNIPISVIRVGYSQSMYAYYLTLDILNLFTLKIESLKFKFWPNSYEPGETNYSNLGLFGIQWRPLTFMESVAIESFQSNDYIRIPAVKWNTEKSVEDHIKFAKETFGWEKTLKEFKPMPWLAENVNPDETTGRKGLYFTKDYNNIFEQQIVANPDTFKIYEL